MSFNATTPYGLLADLDAAGRQVNRDLRRDIGVGWRGVLLRVGSFRFLVDMDSLSEVTDPMPLANVPLAGAGVLGIGNLRGLVLPVFDMSQLLLGEPLPEDKANRRVVVAPQGSGMAGLLVSQVEGMRRCIPSQRRREADAPETAMPFITGGFDLGHRLHPVLDLDLFLSDSNRFSGDLIAGFSDNEQPAAVA
ncbi:MULTISPECIES: chemotaxis protein CheW [unclassified Thioalkalivibrio]|uniref:chemotaxis protein CheW n=1 Tax=unclassified Thioalkalivibrio TaxID=2621013 RepID=UPI00036B12E9|nr:MULTISPECIES: chemotaxis protein CheW [unclassified Thioalkalivibrio]